MTVPTAADEQRRALQAACRRAQLDPDQLWLRYFALGGDAGPVEVEAYLHAVLPLPEMQRDVLAHAVNERLDELAWHQRVPYARTLREETPEHGPLAALVRLLDGVRLAPPDTVAALCTEAGRTLGVHLSLLLVDEAQRELVAADGTGAALALESTLPGRAFRLVQTVQGTADDRRQLWVPVLDGVDRLGVLAVVPGQESDVDDPRLREQCRWVAGLLGQVLKSLDEQGDALIRRRRPRPLDPAAELVQRMLPPLTGGTDRVTVSGLTEPAAHVSGDAFDYSLGAATVSLAVFDAGGDGLEASLRVAAALSGYRSARRRGAGLYEQVRAIDEVVALSAAGSQPALVTGVVAELEVSTGRVRYASAAHPPPLLVRDGHVVRTLSRAGRGAFGLDEAELTVGEETLQPDDWLLLHTDGAVEARGHSGDPFGRHGLVDVLEREASAGLPVPETVRRLVHAVRAHEQPPAAQDATVLVAHWHGIA